MPVTPHSSLMENDADHTFLACFLHTATNRDPLLIQTKLASQYGGSSHEYHLLHLSPRSYLVMLPEFLNRAQVLDDLLLWSVQNHIHLWSWDTEVGWNPTPSTYKLYLEIHNYPMHLWHPKYFHLLVAGFGSPLYIDEANSTGPDRSTLRITIRCVDPTTVPWFIFLNYESKWRQCKVALLGWSFYRPRRNVYYRGPSSGGQQTEVEWAGVHRTFNEQENSVHRASLYHAHMSWLTAEERNSQTDGQRARQGQSGDRSTEWRSAPGAPNEGNHKQKMAVVLLPNDQVISPLRHALPTLKFYHRSYIPPGLKVNLCVTMRKLATRFLTTGKKHRIRGKASQHPYTPSLLFHSLGKLTVTTRVTTLLITPCNRTFSHPVEKNKSATTKPKQKIVTSTYFNHAQPHNTPRKNHYSPRSILGPHPSSLNPKPKTLLHTRLPNTINLFTNPHPPPLPTANKTSHISMATFDPSDEELIRKFSDLQTTECDASDTLLIPDSVVASRNWSLCLRVKVCTDSMVFDSQFEKLMRRAWRAEPSTKFTPTEKGAFLIDFSSKIEIDRVLYEGPWIYRQDLVAISTCESQLHLSQPIEKAELWIQFHKVDMDSLTQEGLILLAKKVGEPLSDPICASVNGKRCFRVRMLVSILGPLKDKVRLRHPISGEITAYLVYEKIGRLCQFCGKLGHDLNSCADRTRLARIKTRPENMNREDLHNILKPSFGPWRVGPEFLPSYTNPPTANREPQPNTSPNTQPSTGLKRSLDETFQNPPPADLAPTQVGNLCLLLPQTDYHGSMQQQNELLASSTKRAKAARPSPPRSP